MCYGNKPGSQRGAVGHSVSGIKGHVGCVWKEEEEKRCWHVQSTSRVCARVALIHSILVEMLSLSSRKRSVGLTNVKIFTQLCATIH